VKFDCREALFVPQDQEIWNTNTYAAAAVALLTRLHAGWGLSFRRAGRLYPRALPKETLERKQIEWRLLPAWMRTRIPPTSDGIFLIVSKAGGELSLLLE